MARMSTLTPYNRKRNFNLTPEPPGVKETAEEQVFVIQKHAASHLHYDLRLAIDGVLVSWAVPKGMPTRIGEKHLAIQTEDHPMSYLHFEGIIPKGEYGGGTVMVWDYGTYVNIKHDKGKLVAMEDCLTRGTIEIILNGKKMRGPYALIKTHYGKNQWLLLKMRPVKASPAKKGRIPVTRSALTGRTMAEISKQEKKKE